MDVAFAIFDDMTALDFVGAFDPITRIGTMGFADLEWDVCARTETVMAAGGLAFRPDRLEPDLGDYDVIVVPGGSGTRKREDDEAFLGWLRTAAPCDLKVSVCTGSLLYGAAGFLQDRRATTHPSAYDRLAEYCEVAEDRVVDDGDLITARGVSSSIDCGLYVVERLTDRETREAIREQMDYPYGADALA